MQKDGPGSKPSLIGHHFPLPLTLSMTSDENSMALSKVRQLTRQYSTDFTNGRITFSGTKGSDKHRITLTMAWHSSVSWYSRTTIILTLISLILNTIAFVSPYWMLVVDALGTSYSGLWTVCIFEVCGDFLNHHMFIWFHIVQTMMCFSLLSLIISLITFIIYIVTAILKKNKRRLAICALAFMIIAAITSFTGVTLYGVEQGKRGVDTLSWAFMVAILAFIFMVLSTVSISLEVKLLYSEKPSDQIPIIPAFQRSLSVTRPVLNHSPSVDSCIALEAEDKVNERADKLPRPRSASQVRMRVNSISCDCPPTPLPGEYEEESGAVFDFENECCSA